MTVLLDSRPLCGWGIVNRARTERYCVIPFLLPPPKNPCPARAQKASQAGRRRFDPGRPLSLRAVTRQGFRLRPLRAVYLGHGLDGGVGDWLVVLSAVLKRPGDVP